MKIALQTYTIRLEAEKNLSASLERLGQMGIPRVELARIPFSVNTAHELQVQKIQIVSIQAKAHLLEKNAPRIIDFCQKTGCSLVVVSVLSWEGILGIRGSIRRFSARLNRLSETYRKFGIRVAFHHHDFEFRKRKKGIIFEELIQRTLPDVSFVVDTFWVRRSGYDPAKWVRGLGKRVIGLHLRDCLPFIGQKRPGDCPLGKGIIDFREVLTSLPESVEYGAIEQNSKHPWVDLEISLSHLRSLGIPGIDCGGE